jgi:hypothetical protein
MRGYTYSHIDRWEEFMKYAVEIKSRDNTVGIATGYELDDRGVGVLSPGGCKNVHFSMSFRPALGPTQPPIQ